MPSLSHQILCLVEPMFGILSSSSTAGPFYILLGMSTCGCESLSLTCVALKTVLLLSRESKLEQVLTLPRCLKDLRRDFLLLSPRCQSLPSNQTHKMSCLFTSRYFSARAVDLEILPAIIKTTPSFVDYFNRIVFHRRSAGCNLFSFSFCSQD